MRARRPEPADQLAVFDPMPATSSRTPEPPIWRISCRLTPPRSRSTDQGDLRAEPAVCTANGGSRMPTNVRPLITVSPTRREFASARTVALRLILAMDRYFRLAS